MFRAPRLWEFNVCGAAVAGIGGSVVLLVQAGVVIWLNGAATWLSLLMILNVAVGIPLLFPPGNLIAMFPYAAEVEEGKEVRFYAPFNILQIGMDEIEQIRWSYARTGWVVKLKRRHGVVGRLLIHAAWGRKGRDLAAAIENELVPFRS